jgi:hypothetical protein
MARVYLETNRLPRVVKLRNAMKKLDQELGRCRSTGSAEIVCKKIERRRRLHDNLTLACMRYESHEKYVSISIPG